MISAIITISIFLFISVVLNIYFYKLLKNVNISEPSPFDNLIASGKNGMDIINDFLRIESLKFLNSKLSNISDTSPQAILGFFNNIKSDEGASNYLKGFVMIILASMSKDLKRIFYRYYNNEVDGVYSEDILVNYITTWHVSFLKSLNMSFTSNRGLDFSIENSDKVNSSIMLDLQIDELKYLGILRETVKDK